ncbi:MAG TPA: glycosyltransferase family 87 protein [Fibrella sp.]
MLTFFKKPIFSDYRFIFGVFAALALVVSIRTVFVSHSNNYAIFYHTLDHLINGVDLYAKYPGEYEDRNHYAPSFGALFSPIFILPYSAGLFLWHFLFTAVWAYAIYRLPLTHHQKVVFYWFAAHELFTSIANSQTNPLIAALPIFAFLAFEKRQPVWAAFFLILGFNIKIYSLVGGALFLLYPQKGKFLLSMVGWGVVMGLFPLLFTTPATLLWQYQNWTAELFNKSAVDMWANTSIHRLVHQVVSPAIPGSVIIGVGVVIFCSVFVHVRRYRDQSFQLLLLASVLIFQVIFNPVAESPTYIIAVSGVMIWWSVSPQSTYDLALLIACLIFTVLSPSDLFPKVLRDELVKPYVLKALPCVLIWFRLIYLMHIYQPSKDAPVISAV